MRLFRAAAAAAQQDPSTERTARVSVPDCQVDCRRGSSLVPAGLSDEFGVRSIQHCAVGRQRDRWFRERIADQVARLRPVIIAELHHRTRLGDDRRQPIKQSLRRHRLAQIFVDAEPNRLDHAPALAMRAEQMIGTSGTGNTPGDRTIRTNSAPLSSGNSQSRITMSGVTIRMASSPAMPSLAS